MIAFGESGFDRATRRLKSPLPVSILAMLRGAVANYHADYLGRGWDFFHGIWVGRTPIFAASPDFSLPLLKKGGPLWHKLFC